MRQPPVWSNGAAATVIESSSHRSISQGNRFAASLAAKDSAGPIITARRSRLTLNTARCAWTVLRNGVLGSRITGGVTASSTRLLLNGIVNDSTFGTKKAVCAIS